jgi:hypothetical protein
MDRDEYVRAIGATEQAHLADAAGAEAQAAAARQRAVAARQVAAALEAEASLDPDSRRARALRRHAELEESVAGHLEREAELAQTQADSARAHAATAKTRAQSAVALGPSNGLLGGGATGGAG